MRLVKHFIKISLLPMLMLLPMASGLGAEQPAGKAEALINRGEVAAAESDWQTAQQQFLEAVRADEHNKVALYDLGIASYHLGEFKKAITAEKAAIDIDSAYMPAYIQLSTILLKMQDAAGAEVALRKALQVQPDSKLVQDSLDKLLSKKEDKNGKVADTKHGSTTDGGATAAKVSTSAPGVSKAATTAKRSSILDENSATPSKVETSRDSEPGALSSAAEVLKSAGAPPSIKALTAGSDQAKDADSAISKGKDSANQSTPAAGTYIEEANVYLGNLAVESARQALLKAEQIDQKNAQTHATLGLIYGIQGDLDKEVEELRQAVQLAPDNVQFHLNLAWSLTGTHKWPEAIKEYETLLTLKPGLPQAEAGKAFVQGKTGHFPQALKVLSETKEKCGSEAFPCVALSTLYVDHKKINEAKAELAEALKREPDNVEANNAMAKLDLGDKDWQGAVDLYQHALATAPYDLEAHLGLGNAQEEQGDKDGAFKTLKAAVDLAPANAQAHASLSRALEQLGRKKEAEDEARAALKLDPKQELAQGVLHRVTQAQ